MQMSVQPGSDLLDARPDSGHFVPRQKCFQAIDLTELYGAFRRDHDIDGSGPVSRSGERPTGEIEVEPFRRSELEKAEGVVGELLQGSATGRKSDSCIRRGHGSSRQLSFWSHDHVAWPLTGVLSHRASMPGI